MLFSSDCVHVQNTVLYLDALKKDPHVTTSDLKMVVYIAFQKHHDLLLVHGFKESKFIWFCYGENFVTVFWVQLIEVAGRKFRK